MNKIKFYVCPECGNIIFSKGKSDLKCCDKQLTPLVPHESDEQHKLNIEEIENDFYITLDHEMTKESYISFTAYVTYNKVLIMELYPEQNAEIRFPKMYGGIFYLYCTEHGLMRYKSLK